MYVIYIENHKALTGNQLKGIESWKYGQYKLEITVLLQAYFDKSNPPPDNKKYMRVEFVLGRKGVLDKDNLWFSAKPWLDVLQQDFMLHEDPFVTSEPTFRPVIKDDSPKYIDLQCSQVKGKKYFVEIILLPTRYNAPYCPQ
jgi:hypothetical protein